MSQSETQPALLKRPWRIPTHVAVIGLIGFLLVLVTLLSGFVVWREYEDALSRAEIRAANAAQTASEHVRWIVEASFQALRRIDEALRDNPAALAAGGLGNLTEAVASLPPETSLWVYNAQGHSILSTNPGEGQVNIADRGYFQSIKAGQEWYVSTLLEDRNSKRKVFTISRRIDRDGVFMGAAVVVVPVELLSQFWVTLGLGPDSSVGLIRDDGWLVARHPIPQATMDFRGELLFTEYLPRSAKGFYHGLAAPADEVPAVVGYNRVPGLPLIAIAGISKESALVRMWTRLLALGLFSIPLLLALLAVSAWIAALLRHDERNREQLTEALEQNRMLLREVHHRVKNNLQVVASLVRLQPGPPEAKAEMARRIAAMSAVHEQLYLSDQFGPVDLSQYVRKLVDNLTETYGSRAAVKYHLARIDAEIELALPLGLIVSEITSNAFKHAFPDGRQGTITVELSPEGEDRAVLRISDDGVGFDPQIPQDGGLGLRLLKAFSQQLAASYTFHEDGGTRLELSFPLALPSEAVSRRIAAAA